MLRKLGCIFACMLITAPLFLAGLAYAQTSSPVQALPFTPQVWLPLGMIIALMIIGIAAVVYMLGKAMTYQYAIAWAKAQIYEAFLSIILLAIFSSLVFIFFINPQSSYASLGLVPDGCQYANNIYELAACDLGTFTQATTNMFSIIFYAAVFAANSTGFRTSIASFGQPNLNFTISLNSVFPTGFDNLLGWAFNALLFMLLLNNIQLIIISSSMLFLSFFLTLGLIARIFGVTRTFGGAMIALGLGLGLVYPILITISYGFISTVLQPTTLVTNAACFIPQIVSTLLFGTAAHVPFGCANTNTNIIADLGFLIAGLTFIPFLNFLILDAFITDFSKAVGEQISFMSMISGLI